MKITALYISNFLGARSVDVVTSAPVQLFAGPNGAGKSSIRDAVALALTGDLGRVGLKKEAGALVSETADAAVCEMSTSTGEVFNVTITSAGKMTSSTKDRGADPVLPYVIEAQRFAQLDPTARRAFLFGLMGVKADPGDIARRLETAGCHIGKVQRILPLLRSGFDAASKEAKVKATEAKGAWRTVTGETYGSEKAKTWVAVVPTYDQAAAKALATEIEHCDIAAQKWQQEVGKLQAESTRRADLRAKLPALKEQAARMGRIEDKLATDRAEAERLAAELATVKAAAGAGPRIGLVHTLARSLNALMVLGSVDADSVVGRDASAAMTDYEAEHGKVGATGGDPAARERLPAIVGAHRLTTSAVANDLRDLQAAQQAKASVDSIEAELAEVFDAEGMDNALQQLDKLKAERADVVKKSDTMKSVKAAIDSAEKKTADAAAHHADVAAWDAIGDALAPDGIPANLLTEALVPMNLRLERNSQDTGWPMVHIHDDMGITADARDYRLLSESEQWRVDAMVAEAIAFLSGVHLLVLDRFDVLDLPGRGELLGWLDALAMDSDIDTALIFGTLKALPVSLPESIAAHWIDHGVVGQLKAAA